MMQSRAATDQPFRIGTRGSPLALWQANTVRKLLLEHHALPDDAVTIVKVKTTGDLVLDRRLAEIGGKGLFTKELESSLARGEVDCAVHSLKDVPTFLPDGMLLAAYLEREDPRDALIAPGANSLESLKEGAVVGTASLRREAILRNLRPDLDVVLLRGNVGSRLKKVADGELDAAILAYAGLKRLELTGSVSAVLDPCQFMPAVGQGIVAIEVQANNATAIAMVEPLNDTQSQMAALTERGFLARLDGSCQSPIAGHARISNGNITFEGCLMTRDGIEREYITGKGVIDSPETIGNTAAETILSRASASLLEVLEGD